MKLLLACTVCDEFEAMGISLKEAEENSCAETVPTFILSNHCQKCVSTISLLYRVKLAWSLRNKTDVSEVCNIWGLIIPGVLSLC